MTLYRIFGLTVDSEVELPGLLEAPLEGDAHVRIRSGTVPLEIPEVQASGVLFQASRDQFLLRHEHLRVLVRGGSEIEFECRPQELARLRVLLMGSCFGALLHQRGMLALHAGSIGTARGAVLFAGASGAGKSTLLGALLQRGYPLISEDLTAIGPDGQGGVRVEPSIPRVRLWPDSAERLGYAPDALPRDQPGIEKVVIPVPNRMSEPSPLCRIYILNSESHIPDVRLETLAPVAAFRQLLHHTYRPRFMKGLGTQANHFSLATLVAGQVPVVRVTRPKGPFLLDELVAGLEADFTP